MQVIRIYLADDHPIYRDGLARAIRRRPDFQVVGEAADGKVAFMEIERMRPDVAVLDVRMPGIDGIGLVRCIATAQIETRVVLVSAFSDSDSVYDAVASGAAAYVHKRADRDQICDTIAAVARGETRLDPMVQDSLLAAIRARGTHDDDAGLTPREREILAMTAEGLRAPDIARRLQLSPATVKSHLQHAYGKFGVSDRTAAVAEAMRRGVLR